MALIHLLRKDLVGEWMPGGYGMTVSRVPIVGEYLMYPDGLGDEGIEVKEPGPYRVTKVQHYPVGIGGCDAEVWVERDDSMPR